MIKHTNPYKELLYCGILLLIFFLLTLLIKYYFKPFFIIIFLFFICTPVKKYLDKFKVFNGKVNSIISIFFVNILLIFFVYYIGNLIFTEKKYIFKLFGEFMDIVKNFSFNNNDFQSKLNSYYSTMINKEFLKKSAIYTTDSILSYFVANILVYFILSDKYVILDWIEYFIPKEKISFIYNKSLYIKNIIKIEAILVLLTTLITILGFFSLNIKNSLALGIICGFLDILPYVGTILVFLPLIIYYINKKQFIIAFGLLCLYVLLLIIRQILEAKFMSEKFNIHPAVIILSLYIGMKVLGLIGLLMGPLYVIIAKEILNAKEIKEC